MVELLRPSRRVSIQRVLDQQYGWCLTRTSGLSKHQRSDTQSVGYSSQRIKFAMVEKSAKSHTFGCLELAGESGSCLSPHRRISCKRTTRRCALEETACCRVGFVAAISSKPQNEWCRTGVDQRAENSRTNETIAGARHSPGVRERTTQAHAPLVSDIASLACGMEARGAETCREARSRGVAPRAASLGCSHGP